MGSSQGTLRKRYELAVQLVVLILIDDLKHVAPLRGMPLDDVVFLVGEPGRLVEHAVGNTDLVNVEKDRLQLAIGKA